MNDQTFGETILEVVTMIILTLVVALMVMAALNVSFAPAAPQAKHHATDPASTVLTKQSPAAAPSPARHHQRDGGAGH